MSKSLRETMIDALQKYKANYGQPAVRALLERVAACSAISEIKPERYAYVLAACTIPPEDEFEEGKSVDLDAEGDDDDDDDEALLASIAATPQRQAMFGAGGNKPAPTPEEQWAKIRRDAYAKWNKPKPVAPADSSPV